MPHRMTPEIAIFARWPEPGKAKTRLIPALGAEGAAKLYARLLELTVREARASGLPFHLRITGDDPVRFRDWLGDDLDVRDQGGGDLGEGALVVASGARLWRIRRWVWAFATRLVFASRC